MSMKYIRDYYGVPAKRGGRVRYTGSPMGEKLGTITSAQGPRLRVRFDRETHTRSLHPTWEVEYLDEQP